MRVFIDITYFLCSNFGKGSNKSRTYPEILVTSARGSCLYSLHSNLSVPRPQFRSYKPLPSIRTPIFRMGSVDITSRDASQKLLQTYISRSFGIVSIKKCDIFALSKYSHIFVHRHCCHDEKSTPDIYGLCVLLAG